MTRSTVARLTPLALAMASMVKGRFILGTSNGSDRFWRAGFERFLYQKAEKPTAQTSKSGVIDAEAIVDAWHAKSRTKSI
jgi:hypothetical protein